jgi:hypothetical protein
VVGLDFFPPVDIPVVPHKPWVLKNIPIPPGLYPEVCRIIRARIDAGVYELSNSSYRSRWFCVYLCLSRLKSTLYLGCTVHRILTPCVSLRQRQNTIREVQT